MAFPPSAAHAAQQIPQAALDNLQRVQTHPRYEDLSPVLQQAAEALASAVPEIKVNQFFTQLTLLNTPNHLEDAEFKRIETNIMLCLHNEKRQEIIGFIKVQATTFANLIQKGKNQLTGAAVQSDERYQGFVEEASWVVNQQVERGAGLAEDAPVRNELFEGTQEVHQKMAEQRQREMQAFDDTQKAMQLLNKIVESAEIP
ncbi:hypothetical protein [Parashewanella tropica]|uniref:hypothetical protein n=1 Tax=Parashewanella tropica TaxID=2547970 RepID=UPI00105A22B6|nr:hypothetical protein [Parashewanella tropica]